MKQGAMMAILSSLLTALALPAALLTLTDIIDSKWSIAVDRSDKNGKLLAEVLVNGLQGNRKLSLYNVDNIPGSPEISVRTTRTLMLQILVFVLISLLFSSTLGSLVTLNEPGIELQKDNEPYIFCGDVPYRPV